MGGGGGGRMLNWGGMKCECGGEEVNWGGHELKLWGGMS